MENNSNSIDKEDVFEEDPKEGSGDSDDFEFGNESKFKNYVR